MVVALFVMLAVTGLGLVAVQTATQEIKSAGNYKLGKQAEMLSAAALTVVLGEVGATGDAYWQFVKQRNLAAAEADGSLTPATMDKSYTFSTAAFTGKLMVNPGGDASNLNPTMTVVMDQPNDGFRAPGYSDKYCFKRFEFDSTATVGIAPVTISYEESRVRYSVGNHRAYGVLGPIECDGN